MMLKYKILIIQITLILLHVVLLLNSYAKIFQYTDKEGKIIYVNDINKVPDEYKGELKTYNEKYDGVSKVEKKRLVELENQKRKIKIITSKKNKLEKQISKTTLLSKKRHLKTISYVIGFNFPVFYEEQDSYGALDYRGLT